MSPDRVVVGVESEKAKKVLTKLYKPFMINNFRVIFMGADRCEELRHRRRPVPECVEKSEAGRSRERSREATGAKAGVTPLI